MYRKKKYETIFFFILLAALALLTVIRLFCYEVSYYNTTPFAFSYKYGFISRGLLGTIWACMNEILPWNLMSYGAIYRLSELVLFLYFLLLFAFFIICLNRVDVDSSRNMRYLIVFLSIFTFPMYLSDNVFGHLDVYLVCITLICVILIIAEKAEWLVIPLCVIAECIHQGYVFMNINIVLVLLFYRALTGDTKKVRKKFWTLFLLTLAMVSVLFLYFELFSHAQGENIYDEIVCVAKALSPTGKDYNKSMIDHEILGADVFDSEFRYHIYNYHEFAVFVVFFIPYLILGGRFFKSLLHSKKRKEFLAYLAVFAGSLTVLPEMILKVDYGRYMFVTCFYYIAIIMALMAMGDKNVIYSFNDLKNGVCKRMLVPAILLVYPAFFMPFYDVIISGMSNKVVRFLFPTMMEWFNSVG